MTNYEELIPVKPFEALLNENNKGAGFSAWNSGSNLSDFLKMLDQYVLVAKLEMKTDPDAVVYFASLVESYWGYLQAFAKANKGKAALSGEFQAVDRDLFVFMDAAENLGYRKAKHVRNRGDQIFISSVELKPLLLYWERVLTVRQQLGLGFPSVEDAGTGNANLNTV